MSCGSWTRSINSLNRRKIQLDCDGTVSFTSPDKYKSVLLSSVQLCSIIGERIHEDTSVAVACGFAYCGAVSDKKCVLRLHADFTAILGSPY